MNTPPGYNPLNWNCKADGCFNVKHRPKIEIFAGDLPRNIGMQDIDATVELNGHFLFLEWKSGKPRDLPIGQKIYAERITRLSSRITYVVVFGDCESMHVDYVQPISGGIIRPCEQCSLEGLHKSIQTWVKRVDRASYLEAAE